MANRFLLESRHINELKAAQAENLLSDHALKLYGNLDLELIQEALAIAAQSGRGGVLVKALRKIANGREVSQGDGTTVVLDVDDPAQVAATALAKVNRQDHRTAERGED